MLLMPARKRIVSMILGGPKPPFVQKMGEESGTGEYTLPEGAPDSGVPMELEEAAAEILRAIDKKDAKGLATALLDFHTLADVGEGE